MCWGQEAVACDGTASLFSTHATAISGLCVSFCGRMDTAQSETITVRTFELLDKDQTLLELNRVLFLLNLRPLH